MNALTVVEQDPSIRPFVEAVAIRMADEGVPVRAIARATRVPSDEVYGILRDAVARGAIVDIPKDDWPVGSNRSSRVAFNGTPLQNEEELKFACARYFKATRLEAAILALLLRRSEATKQQLHIVIEQNRPTEGREETDPKMVDVIICHLRKKLRKRDIEIETVWGIGYLITPAGRDKALAILNTPTEAVAYG
jgi:DNA-binding response OmpR family regulator